MSNYMYNGKIDTECDFSAITDGLFNQKFKGNDVLVIVENDPLFEVFKNKLSLTDQDIQYLNLNHFKKEFINKNIDFILQDYSSQEADEICIEELNFDPSKDVLCSELEDFRNPQWKTSVDGKQIKFCNIKEFIDYSDDVIIKHKVKAIVIINIKDTRIKASRVENAIFKSMYAEDNIDSEWVDFYANDIQLYRCEDPESFFYTLAYY